MRQKSSMIKSIVVMRFLFSVWLSNYQIRTPHDFCQLAQTVMDVRFASPDYFPSKKTRSLPGLFAWKMPMTVSHGIWLAGNLCAHHASAKQCGAPGLISASVRRMLDILTAQVCQFLQWSCARIGTIAGIASMVEKSTANLST